jgi:hypothetical protein
MGRLTGSRCPGCGVDRSPRGRPRVGGYDLHGDSILLQQLPCDEYTLRLLAAFTTWGCGHLPRMSFRAGMVGRAKGPRQRRAVSLCHGHGGEDQISAGFLRIPR